MSQPASRLARRLGLLDATSVGVGAMVGTGVFVVWGPAARAAGSWLLLALGAAALVAYCNATSTARLAAVHPQSGGAWLYGRLRLGPVWGALAGYAFVAGKTASCAAAALAVGSYVAPGYSRLVAAACVLAVTAVDLVGVQRTVRATQVLVGTVLVVLVAVLATAWSGAPEGWVSYGVLGGAAGVPTAAALLFFAFAGYARIATLGEEVRDPARTIPRAVGLALGLVLALYLAMALTLLGVLGPHRLAGSERPVALLARTGVAPWLEPVVAVAAAVSALGALLALVAGTSRTAFAMAAAGDLPTPLSAVDPRRKVPRVAALAVGAVALVVVLAGGLVGAVSFSAFTVLVYYAVANAAAIRLRPDERRAPVRSVLGLLACVVLAASLPLGIVLAGAAWLLGALAVRGISRSRARR